MCLEHFIPTLATFGHLIVALSTSLFLAAVIWMLYVAVEPYVRRHWPQAMISWSRLLAGKLRDPLVGRDILWGVLLGVLWSLTLGVAFLFLKREGATPQLAQIELLLGSREILGLWLKKISQSIVGTLQFFFVLFLLRVLLRNKWLALVCFIGIFAVQHTLDSDHPQIVWPSWVIVYALAAGAPVTFWAHRPGNCHLHRQRLAECSLFARLLKMVYAPRRRNSRRLRGPRGVGLLHLAGRPKIVER